MKNEKKKYLQGNAKKIITDYGEIFNISLNVGDIVNLGFEKNSQWLNVTLMERKEPNEYGSTHYLVYNDWKPEDK